MKKDNPLPPRLAEKFLLRFLRRDLAEEVLGDLEEQFYVTLIKKSPLKARLNYWYQVLNYLRPFAISKSKSKNSNNYAMFQNNFKFAIRNFWRHKIYSAINVSGLAISMACCILIFRYVQFELAFDKHHRHFNQIYRLLEGSELTGEKSAVMEGALLPHLRNEVPEIEKATRIHQRWDCIVSYEQQQFIEKGFLFADPEILDIFTLPLMRGDKNNVFSNPSSILITEHISEKYFGGEDPIGKTILLDNEHEFTITGVLQNIPGTSHFQISFLAPIDRMMEIHKGILENWYISGTYIYFLLNQNADIARLEQKVQEVGLKHNPHVDEDMKARIDSLGGRAYLEPLKDIHLYSADTQWDFLADKSDISYVSAAVVVALLLLIIAGFNFMNLTTARASHRSKEIGIKKVLGINGKQLVFQFYTETFLYTILALLFAVLLAQLSLPFFNQLTGKTLHLGLLSTFTPWLGIILLAFLVFLLAGSYPAFYLSRLNPLKNMGAAANLSVGKGNVKMHFRHLFVVAQFVISITLMISSFFIARQIEMMTEVRLGFDKDHVLVINNPWDDKMVQRRDRFAKEISGTAMVSHVGSANMIPAGVISDHTNIGLEGTPDDELVYTGKVSIGPEFFKTIGAEIIAGRDFLQRDSGQTANAVILNETAVKKLQLQDPIGATIRMQFTDEPKQVVGVVKDMQYESLHVPTKAVVYSVRSPANTSSIFVKVKPGDLPTTIAYLEQQWESTTEKWPFRFEFMDDRLRQLYQAELKALKIIKTFTALTIFIAGLGLFGLASFTTAQRTKEIGIRKVLGASVHRIVVMLSQDFSKWIAIAFLIAIPIAYWLVVEWLKNFAYKVEISWWVFAAAGILVIAIAWLTISYQAIKSAIANPVDSLRSE